MNWKTEYGYGLEERLESAQLPGGKTVTYGYDGFNRMIQRKLGNLHTVTYEYETPSSGKTSGRLSRMINGGTALSYTYDAAGNIVKSVYSKYASNTWTHSYTTSYNGTPGEDYRAYVTFYVKDGSIVENDKTRWSAYVTAQ
mgnify:CR=1 FL=1